MNTEPDQNDHPPADQDEDSPAPPVRVCRKCSTRSETAAANCPQCGASYLHGVKSLKGRVSKRVTIVSAIMFVVLAGGLGAKLVVDHNAEVAAKKKATAARVAAQKKAAEEAKAAEDLVQLEQRLRNVSIRDMQSAITKDARSRVNEGSLDGPILNTQCEATAAGASTLYTDSSTEFSCLAVNKKIGGGQVEGYTFHATMNWDKGNYSWGLGQG